MKRGYSRNDEELLGSWEISVDLSAVRVSGYGRLSGGSAVHPAQGSGPVR